MMVLVNGVKFIGVLILFGGMKVLGFGCEGGVEGFELFMEIKYFCFGNFGLFVVVMV